MCANIKAENATDEAPLVQAGHLRYKGAAGGGRAVPGKTAPAATLRRDTNGGDGPCPVALLVAACSEPLALGGDEAGVRRRWL